jgi:hypothetical protein
MFAKCTSRGKAALTASHLWVFHIVCWLDTFYFVAERHEIQHISKQVLLYFRSQNQNFTPF